MRVYISTQISPHFLKFCPLVRYLQCHLVCILLITVKMEHLKKKKKRWSIFSYLSNFDFPFLRASLSLFAFFSFSFILDIGDFFSPCVDYVLQVSAHIVAFFPS